MATPKGIPTSLRNLRTIHLVLLFSVGLYAYAAEVVHIDGVPKDAMPMPAFAAIAGIMIVLLGLVRWRMLAPARQILRAEPENGRALRRWRASYITAFALCETFVIYGFLMRVSSGSRARAVPFYACAVVLFLIFTPRRP